MADNPGLSPAVQQALDRRGQGATTPPINQMSPDARQANPATQPTNPSEVETIPQVPQAAPNKYTPQSQDDLIVEALIEQLKNNNKLQKQQNDMGASGSDAFNTPNMNTSQSPKQQQTGYPY